MAALRRGIHHRFAPPQQSGTRISNQGRHRGPGRFRRRAGSIPGNWFLVPSAEKDLSLIEVEEQRKDLVRILLDRYGILFRELLHRESPPFRWGTIFRALRLMELSGEILSGYFFRDIPGPQFISPPALRLLRFGLPHEEIYWMNAADPASIAGIPLEGLRGRLPKRLEGTHISFKGAQPQLISRSLGRDLTILIPPDHPDLIRHLAPLRHLLDREFRPLKRIIIHRINEEPAVESPYLEALKEHFHTVTDISRVSLYPKIL
jgi:ATP-dependent Lhr-like helicase